MGLLFLLVSLAVLIAMIPTVPEDGEEVNNVECGPHKWVETPTGLQCEKCKFRA